MEGWRLGSFENCLSARLSRNKDAGLAEPLKVSPNTYDGHTNEGLLVGR